MHDLEKVMKMIRMVAGSLISLIISLIILFVFANILFGDTLGVDPIKNLTDLVKEFIGAGKGGFAGLLALVLLVTFYYHAKDKD